VSRPFRILYVCTGNICRSPLAERLTRHELARRLGPDVGLIEVDSAGTRALTGQPMYADAARVLTAAGGEPTGFVARMLQAELVGGADLILTASRRHRAAVARLEPTASRRTFTIREFGLLAAAVDRAELPDGDSVTRLRAAVELACSHRGHVRADDPDGDDVPDPYGGPVSGYEKSGALIRAATAPTLDLLVAAAVRGPTAARAATS
jgi:protein-tyrosine phosphatase